MRRSRASALLRWLVILAAATAGVAGGALLFRQVMRPKVTVTRLVEGRIVDAFYATGTLQPVREYPIKSNNPGVLTEVYVDKGDKPGKGQPLAHVYEDSVQYRFAQSKAELDARRQLAAKDSPVLRELDARIATAKEILEIAQREQKRVSMALEQNAASQADLDRALDRVKTASSEVQTLTASRSQRLIELHKELEVAEAAMQIAQWNLDRQVVRCPIEHGTVLNRPLPVGTRVPVNESIMLVADVRPEKLVMRAQVDEEDKVNVRQGQMVHMTLYAFAGKTFTGKVSRIYDKADPDRRTFEVDVEMQEKDAGFSAGMTGELAFVVDEKQSAPVVPSQAIQAGQLWVVRGRRLVLLEDATLGLRSIERTEIVSGVLPDDLVVISPARGLEPGQEVRTEYMDPAAAAGLNRPKREETFRGGF